MKPTVEVVASAYSPSRLSEQLGQLNIETPIVVAISDDPAALTARCSAAEGPRVIPVLRVQSGSLVGPTFCGRGSACFRCGQWRIQSHDLRAELPAPDEQSFMTDALWEWVVVREVAALSQAQPVPPLTINHLIHCSIAFASIQRHRILRAPACDCALTWPTFPFSTWREL